MIALERTDPSAIDPATRRELARVDIFAAVRALSVIARLPRAIREACAEQRRHWLDRLREACTRALDARMSRNEVATCAGYYAGEVGL